MNKQPSWGRTRRPKNILSNRGKDWVTVAGNASSDVVDNTAPVDDLAETISGISRSGAYLTFTTANALGTDVFDGVTGHVITDGLHPLIDGKPLRVVGTTDGSNQTTVVIPEELNSTQIGNLNLQAAGTLRQRSTHGVRTENARFLHLYVDDTGDDSETVEVWGYNYAFGRWAPLTFASDLDGSVNDAFKSAIITVTSAPKMVVLPINGIDKVYFKTASDNASVVISAAISTF